MNRRSFLSGALVPAAFGAGLVASGASLRPASANASERGFPGLDGWLNTPAPLTPDALRGKVVLVEFGTYTCINWRRTLPYVNRWHREYGPIGLQVITVHTPEFSFERDRSYIERVLPTLGVANPVALDGQFHTWRAWQNRSWPALYLLDRDGRPRLLREGEGHSAEIETAIRRLLGLSGGAEGEDADLSRIRTAEFYFGAQHGTPQDAAQAPRRGEATYVGAGSGPALNEYDLDGAWARGEEPLVQRSATGRVRVRFSAAKLHLVAGSATPALVRVRVDGGPERVVEIGLPTLYTLHDGHQYGEHLLELESATPGLTLYSATFG